MIKYRDTNMRIWLKKNPILFIIGFGIILRLVLISIYNHVTIYPDSSGYIDLSDRILDLNLRNYEGQRSPGYSLLISLCLGKPVIVVFVQNIIGISTTIITFKTLIRLNLSKKYALVITLLIATYLPIIFFELSILSETLTLFFISFIFYKLISIIRDRENKLSYYIQLSFLCSFLVLIKPFYIFMPFILFIILLTLKKTWKVIYRDTVILIFPILTILGWCQINYINTGYFTPTTFYGFNTAQNCVSFAEKTTVQYKQIGDIYAKYRDANILINRGTAMSIWEAYDELEDSTQLSFVDLSNLLYKYSITTIKQNKILYLKQVCISWTDFWKTSFYWQPENISSREISCLLMITSSTERIIVQILKIIFILFIPYNFIYYFNRRKHIPPTPQFVISLIVLTASILQAIASYGTNSRFSFPFEPLIIISVLLNINILLKQKRQPR